MYNFLAVRVDPQYFQNFIEDFKEKIESTEETQTINVTDYKIDASRYETDD